MGLLHFLPSLFYTLTFLLHVLVCIDSLLDIGHILLKLIWLFHILPYILHMMNWLGSLVVLSAVQVCYEWIMWVVPQLFWAHPGFCWSSLLVLFSDGPFMKVFLCLFVFSQYSLCFIACFLIWYSVGSWSSTLIIFFISYVDWVSCI